MLRKKKNLSSSGGGHNLLELLLCHTQIVKAATYAERWAKMSTLRNAWFENTEKKSILGKVAFYEIPCIFFFIFNISGKSMKQELPEMVQVTVPNFIW